MTSASTKKSVTTLVFFLIESLGQFETDPLQTVSLHSKRRGTGTNFLHEHYNNQFATFHYEHTQSRSPARKDPTETSQRTHGVLHFLCSSRCSQGRSHSKHFLFRSLIGQNDSQLIKTEDGPTTLVLLNSSPAEELTQELRKVNDLLQLKPIRLILISYAEDFENWTNLPPYAQLYRIPETQFPSNLEQNDVLNDVFLQTVTEAISTPLIKVQNIRRKFL